MRLELILAAAILGSTSGSAQEIVKLPPGSNSGVSRPDDIFTFAPGQWHFAKQLWQGNEACTAEQCEAGYTIEDLVLSVEHAKGFVRIIAGVRNCEATAFSEMETGKNPSKHMRKKVAKQVAAVAKGLGKSCKAALPAVAPLDVALLFPAKAAQ